MASFTSLGKVLCKHRCAFPEPALNGKQYSCVTTLANKPHQVSAQASLYHITRTGSGVSLTALGLNNIGSGPASLGEPLTTDEFYTVIKSYPKVQNWCLVGMGIQCISVNHTVCCLCCFYNGCDRAGDTSSSIKPASAKFWRKPESAVSNRSVLCVMRT